MRSSEIISRIAVAGSMLGALVGGVDMVTNPGVKKLFRDEIALQDEYDYSKTCIRGFCAESVGSDKSINDYYQERAELDMVPENQDARVRRAIDLGLMATGIATGGLAGYKALTKEEEAK